MIRDPSDGSIKPTPPKPDLSNSGLAKPDSESEWERKKLEQDREWLKNWKSRNGISGEGETK